MQELQRKIAAIRFRLRLFRVLDWAFWGLLAGLCIAALLMLVVKFVPVGPVYLPIAGAIVAGAVLLSAIAAAFRRVTMFEAALRADVQLNLRERLSSALALADLHRQGEMAYAALEDDAVHYARALQPTRDFRYKAPRHARHTVWPALACVLLYFAPTYDLFHKPAPPPSMHTTTTAMTPEERKKEAEKIHELAKQARKREENLQIGEDLKFADKLERLSQDVSLGRKDKKEAMAEMSRLGDDMKLQQRDMQKMTQPFKQIQGLKQADHTQDLQRDMKDQKFEAAAEKMQKLADDVAKMSAEEKQEVAEELKQLAQQTKDNEQMSDALQKAAEAVEQAAKQQQQQEQTAQQQPQQQTQQQQGQQGQQQQSQQGQQQQGQQQGQQQQQAGAQQQQQQGGQQPQPQQGSQGQQSKPEQASAGQQGSQQQQQAANQSGSSNSQQSKSQQSAAGQQSQQQAAAAMKQASQQMQQMQQMAQQMQQLSELQNQLSQCQGGGQGSSGQQAQSQSQPGPGQGQGQGGQGQQPGNSPGQGAGEQSGQGPGSSKNGQGEWAQGNTEAQGNGSGGPGRGNGGRPPDDGSSATGFVDSFIPGQKNEGEIIAVFEVDAQVPKGESNIRYKNVPGELRQNAADAMRDTEIPVGYRNAVKDYFESIHFDSDKKEK